MIDGTKDLSIAKQNLRNITDLLIKHNFSLKNTDDIREYITYKKTKKPFDDAYLESISSKVII